MDAMVRWKLPAAALLPAVLFAVLLLPASFVAAAPEGAVPNGSTSDRTVRQATYQTIADAGHVGAPIQKPNEPMPIGSAGRDSSDSASVHGGHRDAPATPSSGPALLSMFGSLAVVIGLFLGLVWLLKRGSPKAARLLSSEVVELLGRSPLAGRQQMHVIRFANRLLLVAVSTDGAETLAEINDPVEVDRIAGLCQQTQTGSATQAFRQIFGQLADLRRPAKTDPAGSVDPNASIGTRESAISRQAEDDDV